ncbi:hypothetical protein [Rhizobium sp. C1]|uniref:hypothetical protein n=1 Tax=Rhizobium sp. C1 TaxID=1349799 RepID=UPI001E553009|nr:hypothetical protein [Rhizobium sp. C1]MCD2176509.1 hypothetical protein [Rhizobium sp. C1]
MLNSVSVQRAQGVDTSAVSPREREEKQKKAVIPSVEVTAAQMLGVSARVGDFLVNKASQSSDGGSGISGPTGADGMLPAGMPVGGPPPGPPAGSMQGEGHNGGGASGSAASILSLLSGEDSSSEAENDGDADDSGFSPSSRPNQGANTQFARQQSGDGVFGVQFDEIGAYQFAASGF